MRPEHAFGARRCACSFFVIALASIALASTASAQDRALHLETIEHGSWADSVAALQHDLAAEGSAIHAVVLDGYGDRAPCGSYVLALDDAGTRAFSVASCDPGTSATAIQLVSRSELFVHDGELSRPRMVRLAAREVRLGDATGGAPITGGAAVACSVAVRPYLDDLEHGTSRFLGPDHYVLRPTDTSIVVTSGDAGWALHAPTTATLTIEYDVLERASGALVLHDRAVLACGTATTPPAAPASPETAVLSARAARVRLLESRDLPRSAEILGVLVVHEPRDRETLGVNELREQAAALGADAVVGIRLDHELSGGRAYFTGLAVRFVELRHAW